MSNDNKQNQSPRSREETSGEQTKPETEPIELPEPNEGETVTKGG